MPTINVFHSSATDSWGTPSEYIEAARRVLGGIDLDPASSAEWNETVKATFFFDEEDNGLEQEWFGNVFLNPPGGKVRNESLSGLFWRKLIHEREAERFRHAIVVAFNLNALQQTQAGFSPSMCFFPFCVPAARVKYRDGLTGEAAAPPHASAFVYVPGTVDVWAKFRYEFSRFGAVVNGGM